MVTIGEAIQGRGVGMGARGSPWEFSVCSASFSCKSKIAVKININFKKLTYYVELKCTYFI